LALAKASAKGISDKDIQNEIPDLGPDQRAGIINRLLAQVFYFELRAECPENVPFCSLVVM